MDAVGTETVSWSKLIFADGTTVWTRGGPAADHIFHPVMLKYVLICVLLYALLHTRAAMDSLALWQIALYWFMVVIVSTFWLFLAAAMANRMLRSGHIQFIFTPLISLPLIFINESLFQTYMVWGLGRPYEGLGAFAPFIIRDCIVILLFDIQYGTFVAPHHPAYRLSDPKLDTSVAMKRKEPLPKGQTLQITSDVVMATPTSDDLSQPVPEVVPLAAPAPQEQVPFPEAMAQVSGKRDPDGVGRVPTPRPEKAEEEVDVSEMTIDLGGERIRVSDLLVIRAEDHYVRIHQRGRSMLLRGRFSDVVAAVPPEMGILLNRSVWVAVAGIRSLHRTADHRVMIQAVDEQMHPVARSRKAEVMDFARRHSITIARRKFVPSEGE